MRLVEKNKNEMLIKLKISISTILNETKLIFFINEFQ